MRWQFVVLAFGFFGLIAFVVKLRSENKKLRMHMDFTKEIKK